MLNGKRITGTCCYFFNNIYIKTIPLHLDFLWLFWSQANQLSLMKEHTGFCLQHSLWNCVWAQAQFSARNLDSDNLNKETRVLWCHLGLPNFKIFVQLSKNSREELHSRNFRGMNWRSGWKCRDRRLFMLLLYSQFLVDWIFFTTLKTSFYFNVWFNATTLCWIYWIVSVVSDFS